jgi:hypothetical protein
LYAFGPFRVDPAKRHWFVLASLPRDAKDVCMGGGNSGGMVAGGKGYQSGDSRQSTHLTSTQQMAEEL